jgi:hypothetical protein
LKKPIVFVLGLNQEGRLEKTTFSFKFSKNLPRKRKSLVVQGEFCKMLMKNAMEERKIVWIVQVKEPS